MALSDISVADLEAMLKERRAQQEETDKETPHSRVLADLRDGRFRPADLADVLERLFAAHELQGVDLLADGGPSKLKRAATPPKDVDPAKGDPSKEGAA